MNNDITFKKAAKLLTSSMQKQGTYQTELNESILLAAGDLLAYCKAIKEADKLEGVSFETKTREGHLDYKVYPVFKLLPVLSKSLSRSLASLGLTLNNLVNEEADPLLAVLAKLEDED